MNAPGMSSTGVLELGVARAVRLIRADRPAAARLALEVATYAADRIDREPCLFCWNVPPVGQTCPECGRTTP